MASSSTPPPINPFDNAFDLLGQTSEVSTRSIHEKEFDQLTKLLSAEGEHSGRIVLLRSPRAGFGKTHLLIRLQRRLLDSHEFIALEASSGRLLDDEFVLDAVLRKLSRLLPNAGGLTYLDMIARRILAKGLEPLVLSGEVPSQDRGSAIESIKHHPDETFDFHNSEALTAQWASSNFSQLGPRLSSELAEQIQGRYRAVAWWVELLFRYSSAPLEQGSRTGSLFETVFNRQHDQSDVHAKADRHEKLATLFNLLGLVTSPVVVLDELEGLSNSPESGLEVVTFLNTLHQSCKKLGVVISVNGDVWQTAFLPSLPCGLKDRLEDVVVDLKPISKKQALEMLRDRAGDRAESITDAIDFGFGIVYPRGVVRAGSAAWSGLHTDAKGQADLEADVADPIKVVEEFQNEETYAEIPNESWDLVPAEVVAEEATAEIVELSEGEEKTDISTAQQIDDTVLSEVEVIDPIVAEEEKIETPSGDNTQIDLADAVFTRAADPAPALNKPFRPLFAMEEEIPQEEKADLNTDLSTDFTDDDQLDQASPFSRIDHPEDNESKSDDTPITSPFTIYEADEADEAGSENLSDWDDIAALAATMPSAIEAGERPHAVTQEDHDRIEDLLRQFRDRYGRE